MAKNDAIESERALRDSEARYRSLVNSAAQAVWTTDPSGRAVADLSAWQTFTGQAPRDKEAEWLEAFHPEDRQLVQSTWREASAHVSSFRVESRLRRYDGEFRRVALRGVPVVDEQNTIREWVWAFIDITERYETERRRSLTNELLSLFARKESSRDYLDAVAGVLASWLGCRAVGIRVTDGDTLLTQAWTGYDERFAELEARLSLSQDTCCCIRAVTGKHAPEDRLLLTPGGSFLASDLRAHQDSLAPEQQKRLRGNCQKFGFRSVAIVPIRAREQVLGAIHLADPRPGLLSPGTVALLEDVAPLLGEAIRRFQAETQLALYRDNLERLVRQRTAELEAANAQLHGEVAQRKRTEIELRRTAAELERSNRDLEQFAYVASHDLQEPLRAISGYLKLVEQRFPAQVDAKAREYMAGVVEAAGRMQTLIRDLLGFARVGSPPTVAGPADLNQALADALRNLRAATDRAGATITSEVLPLVNLDYSLAVQLFQNLIGNAIKFRGVEAPRVNVSAQEEGGQWVVVVRDNGIGIDPQYHQRIFQVFQRLHTRKQYPGTGIGLALCKRIVERGGGRIWVESQAGAGAVFCFALPGVTGKREGS